jgi:hypothetical protein
VAAPGAAGVAAPGAAGAPGEAATSAAISARRSSTPFSSPSQRFAIRPSGSIRKVATTWSIVPSAARSVPTPKRFTTSATCSGGPVRNDQVARSAPRSCA